MSPEIAYDPSDYDPSKDESLCGCGCGRRVCDIWDEGIAKNVEKIRDAIDAEILEKYKRGEL